MLAFSQPVAAVPAGLSTHILASPWPDPIPWDLEKPYLYTAAVAVRQGEAMLDVAPAVTFGFREIWREGRTMMMNGHPTRFRMGLALGLSAESLSFFRLMGLNVFQFQPNPTHFYSVWGEWPLEADALLDRMDAEGLGVIQRAPTAVHLDQRLLEDPNAEAAYREEVKLWLRRQRNHPSILAWTPTMNYTGNIATCSSTTEPEQRLWVRRMSMDKRTSSGGLAAPVALLLLALALLVAAARAGDPPAQGVADGLFRLGFEEYVPGQSPDGWSVSWGEKGDHLVLVSNLEAASGQRALLFDRKVGSVTQPCQLQWTMPGSSHGRAWTELSFCILIDGKASESQFEVSLGDCHPRRTAKIIFSLRGGGPSIHLYPNVLAHSWYQNWDGRREMCQWQANAWHRIRLFLPSQGTALAAVNGLVERRAAGGAWQPVGRPQRVPAEPLQDAALHGYLCTGPQIGYSLFVDDIQASELDALPLEAMVPEAR